LTFTMRAYILRVLKLRKGFNMFDEMKEIFRKTINGMFFDKNVINIVTESGNETIVELTDKDGIDRTYVIKEVKKS